MSSQKNPSCGKGCGERMQTGTPHHHHHLPNSTKRLSTSYSRNGSSYYHLHRIMYLLYETHIRKSYGQAIVCTSRVASPHCCNSFSVHTESVVAEQHCVCLALGCRATPRCRHHARYKRVTGQEWNNILYAQRMARAKCSIILQYACAQFCLWPNIIFKHCNFAQTPLRSPFRRTKLFAFNETPCILYYPTCMKYGHTHTHTPHTIHYSF